MENASKALLMAGGILLALIVVSGLILMWSQISAFYADNSGQGKEEQIIKFNQEFATYDRQNVRGSDLISLVNKVVSYNKKKDNYNDNVQIEDINIKIDFHSASTKLTNHFFNAACKYDSHLDFYNDINDGIILDKDYGVSTMEKLSSNLEGIIDPSKYRTVDGRPGNFTDQKEVIKDIIGRDISGGRVNELIDKIKEYRDYSTFKNLKFDCIGTDYKDGQIILMSFEAK